MEVDLTSQSLCLDLFNKGMDMVLSLITQLPTEYDQSKFELPEDLLQLHAEAAEALKEVLTLTMSSQDYVVCKLLEHIQLISTLEVLYKCTKTLVLECKFFCFFLV